MDEHGPRAPHRRATDSGEDRLDVFTREIRDQITGMSTEMREGFRKQSEEIQDVRNVVGLELFGGRAEDGSRKIGLIEKVEDFGKWIVNHDTLKTIGTEWRGKILVAVIAGGSSIIAAVVVSTINLLANHKP